jgi:uncharacterized protein YcaQ
MHVAAFEEAAARMIGGAAMTDMTHEEALRQALAMVGQALRETEARCAVLAQYINDCDRNGSHTASWSEAIRELHALHAYRRALLRRQSLIQQALDCPLSERQRRHRSHRCRAGLQVGLSGRFRFECSGGHKPNLAWSYLFLGCHSD